MAAWMASMGLARERLWAELLALSRRGVAWAWAGERIIKGAEKASRSVKRWSARSWREIDMLPMETTERILRARARWEVARWREGASAHEWTRGYLEAVSAGLRDPWEVAKQPRVGIWAALNLGAASIWSRLHEEHELKWRAGDGRQSYPKACRVEARVKRNGGRATRRARWMLLCSQSLSQALKSFEYQRFMDWKAKLMIAVMSVALFPMVLIGCWLIASAKAWSVGSWAKRSGDLADENAKRTAREALDWLGAFEQWTGDGNVGKEFGDDVWVWDWAGVSARDFERLESSAWLGNAAATRLPPVERALCSACWMEALAALLMKQEGYVFESSSRHAPSSEFFMVGSESNPSVAGVAEMIRSGLESSGALKFFGVCRSRWRGTWELRISVEWAMMLASHAYGMDEEPAVVKLLEAADGGFAIALADVLLKEWDGQEPRQIEVGVALAHNTRVSDSAGEEFFLQRMSTKMAFDAEREALNLHAELGMGSSSASVEDEKPKAKGGRRL